MRPAPSPGLWGLFWILAALQVVDLGTTYAVLSAGGREGNPFMREVILTPMAPVLKAFALVFLAALIVGSVTRGRPAPHRLRVAMWIVFGVYAVLVLNNVSILVIR